MPIGIHKEEEVHVLLYEDHNQGNGHDDDVGNIENFKKVFRDVCILYNNENQKSTNKEIGVEILEINAFAGKKNI